MDSDQKDKVQHQENHSIEIREKKRLDILKKNRKNGSSAAHIPRDDISTGNTALYSSQSMESATLELVDQIYQISFKIEQFEDLKKALNSQDVLQQHHGCIGIRQLLCIEDNPVIQIVIDANCVPRFIEFIQQSNYPVLQLESVWCLTNITSGTTIQTRTIIDKGAIPLFCGLLTSSSPKISELAIQALEKISGDGSVNKDMIIKYDGLKPLANILLNTQDKMIIKHGSRALSNLCKGHLTFELAKKAVSTLSKVFQMETDSEVLRDISWAICDLSEGNEDKVQLVIDTGIIPSLINHINYQTEEILIPCLRIIGNICTGSEQQEVRKEACWVLSNIAAGNAQQIANIVNENSYIESLFQCILSDSEEVSNEATYVISNCTYEADLEELLRLVDLKVLEIFIHVLKRSQDEKIILLVLESLSNILKGCKKESKEGTVKIIIDQLENLRAKETFKNFQKYPHKKIQKSSLFLLDNVFNINE